MKADDFDAIKAFCIDKQIDMVVVGPEDPLVKGIYDNLKNDELTNNIPVIGPSKQGAVLEGSKDFAKAFMARHHIPTARYQTFDGEHVQEGLAFLETLEPPYVLKADGLCAGKGVLILPTLDEAKKELKEMLGGMFGNASSQVVIEEFLTGPEVSVLAFTDGVTLIPMVSSMDHKRAHDNDEGLNTGGMGTVAPNPYYTKEIADECMKTIFLPTMAAMNAEGRQFRGCLYFGLMLTPKGPKVIEYNCRFGDPETQVVLPLLESDLLTVMQATANGTLKDVPVRFRDGAACCVIVASKGYPVKYESGFPMILPPDTKESFIYVAGAKRAEDGTLLSAGGRVLGVTAVRDDLASAIDAAYQMTAKVQFENGFYRHDIGAKALAAKK
jgi:phosphoribosylamine--glycine ligase